MDWREQPAEHLGGTRRRPGEKHPPTVRVGSYQETSSVPLSPVSVPSGASQRPEQVLVRMWRNGNSGVLLVGCKMGQLLRKTAQWPLENLKAEFLYDPLWLCM